MKLTARALARGWCSQISSTTTFAHSSASSISVSAALKTIRALAHTRPGVLRPSLNSTPPGPSSAAYCHFARRMPTPCTPDALAPTALRNRDCLSRCQFLAPSHTRAPLSRAASTFIPQAPKPRLSAARPVVRPLAARAPDPLRLALTLVPSHVTTDGFQRCRNSPGAGESVPSDLEFHHPCFLRDRRDLMLKISRSTVAPQRNASQLPSSAGQQQQQPQQPQPPAPPSSVDTASLLREMIHVGQGLGAVGSQMRHQASIAVQGLGALSEGLEALIAQQAGGTPLAPPIGASLSQQQQVMPHDMASHPNALGGGGFPSNGSLNSHALGGAFLPSGLPVYDGAQSGGVQQFMQQQAQPGPALPGHPTLASEQPSRQEPSSPAATEPDDEQLVAEGEADSMFS